MATTNPTSPQVLETYTLLQIAAEAFLNGTKPNDAAKPPTGSDPFVLTAPMLTNGNKHSSRMTQAQATRFASEWKVLSHQPNTATGFSGTLFQYTGATDAARGVTNGMLVVSLRSTEFIEDTACDNQATNTLELSESGWAFGQLADMDTWFQNAKAQNPGAFAAAGGKVDGTGHSLGGGGALAAARSTDSSEHAPSRGSVVGALPHRLGMRKRGKAAAQGQGEGLPGAGRQRVGDPRDRLGVRAVC